MHNLLKKSTRLIIYSIITLIVGLLFLLTVNNIMELLRSMYWVNFQPGYPRDPRRN
jgi:hypothetical protein